jgi:hypothetical protein
VWWQWQLENNPSHFRVIVQLVKPTQYFPLVSIIREVVPTVFNPQRTSDPVLGPDIYLNGGIGADINADENRSPSSLMDQLGNLPFEFGVNTFSNTFTFNDMSTH